MSCCPGLTPRWALQKLAARLDHSCLLAARWISENAAVAHVLCWRSAMLLTWASSSGVTRMDSRWLSAPGLISLGGAVAALSRPRLIADRSASDWVRPRAVVLEPLHAVG